MSRSTRFPTNAQARYGNEFQLVGILYDETSQRMPASSSSATATGWPNADDPTGAVALAYGVLAAETFFIDATGVVRAKHYGPLTEAAMAANLALIGVAP